MSEQAGGNDSKELSGEGGPRTRRGLPKGDQFENLWKDLFGSAEPEPTPIIHREMADFLREQREKGIQSSEAIYGILERASQVSPDVKKKIDILNLAMYVAGGAFFGAVIGAAFAIFDSQEFPMAVEACTLVFGAGGFCKGLQEMWEFKEANQTIHSPTVVLRRAGNPPLGGRQNLEVHRPGEDPYCP